MMGEKKEEGREGLVFFGAVHLQANPPQQVTNKFSSSSRLLPSAAAEIIKR
jgi:hypothetical protein